MREFFCFVVLLGRSIANPENWATPSCDAAGFTVSDFADALGIGVAEVIKKLMALGLMVSLNQKIEELEVEIIQTGKGSQINEWMHLVTANYMEKL